ncbi:MAG: hypothetical protein EOP48_25860 [Sphingobacteriales bacterium]|nr:MAG: hypothetical protein EOP48_25860 [Sphingobacteriales bacterium]
MPNSRVGAEEAGGEETDLGVGVGRVKLIVVGVGQGVGFWEEAGGKVISVVLIPSRADAEDCGVGVEDGLEGVLGGAGRLSTGDEGAEGVDTDFE